MKRRRLSPRIGYTILLIGFLLVGGWWPGWYVSSLIPKYDPDQVLLTSEDALGRRLFPPGGCLVVRTRHVSGKTQTWQAYRSPTGDYWSVTPLETLPMVIRSLLNPDAAIAWGCLLRKLDILAPDYYGRLVDTEKARTFLKKIGEDAALADATAELATRKGATVVRVRRSVVLDGDESKALAVVTEEVSARGVIRIVESRVVSRVRGVSKLVAPTLWR